MLCWLWRLIVEKNYTQFDMRAMKGLRKMLKRCRDANRNKGPEFRTPRATDFFQSFDLIRERENYVNLGVNHYRDTVYESGLITPLLHGVQRGLYKKWVPGHGLQFFDGTVFSDNRA